MSVEEQNQMNDDYMAVLHDIVLKEKVFRGGGGELRREREEKREH